MKSEKENIEFFTERQIDEIIDVVISFATLNFDHKAPLEGNSDKLDALAQSINMLGDELQSKLILLKGRERLLKEIHHRVKNNLQIVSSILNLQSNVIADSSIAEKFQDCRNRINSMALVHEQLYLEEDLERIELNTYVSSLLHRLEKSYGKLEIMLNYTGLDKALYLSVDQTIPLGLIISELVMNSYKHGFTVKTTGSIDLKIYLLTNYLEFVFSDSGQGFDNGALFYNSNTLGLQLVHSLIDQLDAELEFKPNSPYRLVLKLPLTELSTHF